MKARKILQQRSEQLRVEPRSAVWSRVERRLPRQHRHVLLNPAWAVGLAASIMVVFGLLAVLQTESSVSQEQFAELPPVVDLQTPGSIQDVYNNYNWTAINEGSPDKKLVVGT